MFKYDWDCETHQINIHKNEEISGSASGERNISFHIQHKKSTLRRNTNHTILPNIQEKKSLT